MSDTDTFEHQFQTFDRLPSKRKLEDYDSTDVGDDAGFRRTSNSKGKSLLELFHSTAWNPSSLWNGGCSSTPVQFFVKMISGCKTLVLQANLKDTVETIHRRIQFITGIPLMEQRLIYSGKQLQWEQTLEECGVQNDAGLQLVGRMRSTGHPRAWRVINDMVSVICRICRKEMPYYCSGAVKGKLEQYMALPLTIDNNKLADFIFETMKSNGVKEFNYRDCHLMYEGYENVGCENINKIDFCKIFMDACAPQALVMLYMSSDKSSQESAEACIRSFVGFMKEFGEHVVERCLCATVVLEFCKLLRPVNAEGNVLYLYSRSTLGSMLEIIELLRKDMDIWGISVWGTTCIGIQDVFSFFKELGMQLLKDLVLSAESNANIGQLVRDVCDFPAFLRPMLALANKRPALVAGVQKANGRANLPGKVVGLLFKLFNELLGQINRCLGKIDLCLDKKKEKEFKIYQSGRSQYLAILKQLHNISALFPGSEDQILTMMRQNKEAVHWLVLRYTNRADDYFWLCKYKDVLDFESRRHLALLMFPEVREDYGEIVEMLIDRSQLLSESFEYISGAQPYGLHAGLFVEFKNEEATGPGVLREWFCLVCQAIFNPEYALFAVCPLDRRRFFPNPASKVDVLHQQYFRFAGRVIALALMHKIQVGVVLDRIFFLQLAGRHVSVEDIRVADPCLYNSCKQILEMDAEFVDSDGLGLTFVSEVEELESRRVVELCPGGREIVVDSQNREGYVNLIVRHRFVQSISKQVSSFSEGFTDILRYRTLGEIFFQSLELEDLDMMLHGSGNEISVEDWKAHTDYDGYRESDPQIVWFWEVLLQLNANQRTNLLFFWTSVKYLPVKGFQGLASRLFIYKSSEGQERLPSSHTCFYRLYIPPYPSKSVMEDRLCVITQEHLGCSFGTW